ncbi:hypothetical protein [Algoriphagus formosus]|uniref:hypothetical protein n=1 Tax=Algoriphagus formosus TaxID=2007308 RepID=UPI003F6F48EC
MKKPLLIILAFAALLFAANFFLVRLIKERLQSTINTNPERSYDLNLEDVEVSIIRGRVVLSTIILSPVAADAQVVFRGTINQIILDDFQVWDFLISRELIIGDLILFKPSFRLTLTDQETQGREGTKAFQSFFEDIITRGTIRNFQLMDGTAEVFLKSDETRRIGGFTDFNIRARGLRTDRRIITHIVPFELDEINTSFRNLKLTLPTKQTFELGSIDFDLLGKKMKLENISVRYDEGLLESSNALEYQQDLIEVELKQLQIIGIDASSDLYGKWSAFAEKMVLDSLVFVDLRNKNKPRPVEEKKKLFSGLMKSIPFPVDMDTLIIQNSHIQYLEVPEGESNPGLIDFHNLNAQIFGFVTVDSLQKSREMTMEIQADFLGETKLNANFQVPYDSEAFQLQLSLEGIELNKLNRITEPLAGVKVNSGQLHRLALTMNANEFGSQNELTFDYENFTMAVPSKGENDGNNGLKTFAGNLALRSTNLPEKSNYRVAAYSSTRNLYRGPFNFIWESTKSGVMEIMPAGVVKIFIPSQSKKKRPKKAP